MSIIDGSHNTISIVYTDTDNGENRDKEYDIETLSLNKEMLNAYKNNGWILSSIYFKFLFEVVFTALILLFQQQFDVS